MALERFANTPTPAAPSTPWTTLNGAITSGALSLTVMSASAFPSLAQFRVLIDSEWILITAGAGTSTWTVTRGVDGSVATAHAHGASIFHVLTAAAFLRNPRSMTTLGDMEYMAADLGPARLAAPIDGDYVTRWTSGVPSWIVAGGGGTPGGSDGEVQFNDGGAFGGSNKLTFNKTTGTMAFPATAKSFSHSTAIDLTQTYTGVANNEFLNPLLQVLTVDPSSGTMVSGAVYGAFMGVYTGTANINYDDIYGLYQDVEPTSAGSIQTIYAAKYDAGRGGSGSVGKMYAAHYHLLAYGSATVASAYGVAVSTPGVSGTAVITDLFSFYAHDIAGTATQPYYLWFDSRGVYRVREDNVADGSGNPQAIPSLYNPRFAKYTPGAANFERSIEQWVGNVLQIGAEKGGTGTLRALKLLGASVSTDGNLTAANLSGTNTGDQTSVTGNAGTATALQTARLINGVSFDGTSDITIAGGTSHELLSATHTDTTAASVARGDLITGQDASPTWKRLAKGTANQVLAMDGTATDIVWFTLAAGSGDVVGPAASVDNAIARFNGTTGKIIQDYTSGAPTIGDTGQLLVADGGAAAPVYSSTSFPGTGFYFGSATSIRIAHSGSQTAAIGSVGWDIISSSAQFGLGTDASATVLRRGGSHITDLIGRTNTNAQTFRPYGYYASDTSRAYGAVQCVKEAITLSGATTATTNIIPKGAFVIGVAITITTTITGASGYQAGDGGDADRYGDITGTAVGTDSDNTDATADPTGYNAAAAAVTLTAKTSNFTGGVAQVVVFFVTTGAD